MSLAVSVNRQNSSKQTEKKTTHDYRKDFVNTIVTKFKEYYTQYRIDNPSVLYRDFTDKTETKTSEFKYFLLNYNGEEGYNPDVKGNHTPIWGQINSYSNSNCNNEKQCDFYFINFLAHMIKYHSDIVDIVIPEKFKFMRETQLYDMVIDSERQEKIINLLNGYFKLSKTTNKYMKYKTKYLTLKNKMEKNI